MKTDRYKKDTYVHIHAQKEGGRQIGEEERAREREREYRKRR